MFEREILQEQSSKCNLLFEIVFVHDWVINSDATLVVFIEGEVDHFDIFLAITVHIHIPGEVHRFTAQGRRKVKRKK